MMARTPDTPPWPATGRGSAGAAESRTCEPYTFRAKTYIIWMDDFVFWFLLSPSRTTFRHRE